MGKLRGALVQESVHAFLLVLRGKQAVEQAALEHHAVGQRAFEGAVRRDSLAAITVICEKPLMVRAAPKASSISLSSGTTRLTRPARSASVGVHHAGGQAHVHGLGLAHGTRQALRAAGTGDDAAA